MSDTATMRLNCRGTTLVELLVASVIILTAVAGALGAHTAINRAVTLSGDRSQAMQDAQLVMEQLRTRQYQNPTAALSNVDQAPGGGTWPDWIRTVKGTSVRMLPDEAITVTNPALVPPEYGGGDLQVIVVEVRWTGPGNPGVLITSLFMRRPLGA